MTNQGSPLDETTRSGMESLLGHELKDIRIHDSHQAGELARRLGSEAFTVGRHIYGPPSKLTSETREGMGLLAHEATHVIQQTRPEKSQPVCRNTLQRNQEEVQAQDIETAVMRSTETSTRETREPSELGRRANPQIIADLVYRMIMRDLIIDRERHR